MVRCITCNVLHMRQFCRFLYCLAWFDTVEWNRLPCPNNEMYDDAVFANRFHYQLTMFGISCIDIAISILSCSYCICNRHWQNHRPPHTHTRTMYRDFDRCITPSPIAKSLLRHILNHNCMTYPLTTGNAASVKICFQRFIFVKLNKLKLKTLIYRTDK